VPTSGKKEEPITPLEGKFLRKTTGKELSQIINSVLADLPVSNTQDYHMEIILDILLPPYCSHQLMAAIRWQQNIQYNLYRTLLNILLTQQISKSLAGDRLFSLAEAKGIGKAFYDELEAKKRSYEPPPTTDNIITDPDYSLSAEWQKKIRSNLTT
jgi:hypothetical protein